jgi:hypothetical protein
MAVATNHISLREIDEEARRDAQRGIFRNPCQATEMVPRDPEREAAREMYSRAYWREFDRLRFERGDYDLL